MKKGKWQQTVEKLSKERQKLEEDLKKYDSIIFLSEKTVEVIKDARGSSVNVEITEKESSINGRKYDACVDNSLFEELLSEAGFYVKEIGYAQEPKTTKIEVGLKEE